MVLTHAPQRLVVAHRQSAARLGAMRSGVSLSCFSSSSSTPRPPVWMQKCSKASAKSGRYALLRTPSTWATTCRTHHDKLSVTEAHSGILEHDMAHGLHVADWQSYKACLQSLSVGHAGYYGKATKHAVTMGRSFLLSGRQCKAWV